MFSVRLPRIALCVALVGVFSQSALALQLDETWAELVARHAPPAVEDHARKLAMYFWDGWSARLEFQGSQVCKITYRRNWYLEEQEITSLLDANGGVRRWVETSDPGAGTRLWSRDDGAAAACARSRPLSFVFESGLDIPDSPVTTSSPATTRAQKSPTQLGAVP